MSQMSGVVSGMGGRRLRYADLIADNGLESGARPQDPIRILTECSNITKFRYAPDTD